MVQTQTYEIDLTHYWGVELDEEQQHNYFAILTTARHYELPVSELARPAWCESRFRTYAKKLEWNNTYSHGIVQINDGPKGMLGHFLLVGYSDPYNMWEALDYYARVKKGEFAPWSDNAPPLHPYGHILASRWSCR